VLPNSDYCPVITAQLSAHKPVSFSIVEDFGIPEFLIGARPLVTLWASMPKTSVNKNDNPFAFESEIRLAQKRLVAPPAGDAKLPKNRNQAQLRCLVSVRADQRHYFRTFLFAPNIAQNSAGPNF
jgi:hypothetical protein